jgi:hypothetical protein
VSGATAMEPALTVIGTNNYPVFQVNYSGTIYINSASHSSITGGTTSILSIDKNTGMACYFDYIVSDAVSSSRAGTIISVWRGSTVEFTDTSTADIGASTTGIEFNVSISGSNLILYSVVTSGTWSIKVGARVI